jgi:hypothetical protein
MDKETLADLGATDIDDGLSRCTSMFAYHMSK